MGERLRAVLLLGLRRAPLGRRPSWPATRHVAQLNDRVFPLTRPNSRLNLSLASFGAHEAHRATPRTYGLGDVRGSPKRANRPRSPKKVMAQMRSPLSVRTIRR